MRFLALTLFVTFFGCTQPSIQKSSEAERKVASKKMTHVTDRDNAAIWIQASCEVACKDGKKQLINTPAVIFDPHNTVRQTVNGGMAPPSITLRLSDLADSACFKEAIANCSGEANIAVLAPKEIRSGVWKATLPFDCKRGRKCVLSPYDPGQAEKVIVSVYGSDEKTIEPYVASHLPLTSKDCKREVSFESCMGDCASDHKSCGTKGAFVETLMTPEPYDRSTTAICMDRFDELLKNDTRPKAVRSALCRMYVRRTILESDPYELACAAFRLNLDNCL